ncbi:MAG: YicC family protein [Paludibacteraceae bacterium]|nr:YicC family protein [Paludibacteraceae bacterium]
MVLSMTGFGKTTCEVGSKKITIEIKSLNSKQLDLFSRVPNSYKEKELELRNIVSQRLERGKIEFSIFVESLNGDTTTQINQALLENYYTQIKSMSSKLGVAEPADWMPLLLRMPDVMKTEIQEVEEEDWLQVKAAFEKAVDGLVEFRTREGESLSAVFEQKIANIRALLVTIDPFEKERVEKIKQRIMDNLAEIKSVEYDKNRFEQEMIYYIEKLDVNEEKNRLRQHLTYFEETMKADGYVGKKLGFIAQEIGREINTLGSKSNHSEMQKIVVKMKDELEQIKEQVLNVL